MTTKLEARGEIVAPGDPLGAKSMRGDFTYIDGDSIRSAVFGIKNEKGGHVSVIPLAGQYLPKESDMVVGVVTDVMRTGWLIKINDAYTAYLNKERRRDDDDGFDLRRLFKEGDLVSVKISRVDEVKSSYADGPRKLTGGRIVMVSAKKIPRIIGSKKSMLTILRDKSGCRIVVGQNGIIWLDGQEQNMQLVIDAIMKIERESHTKGLTDRISEYLDEGMKKISKDAGKSIKAK
jgi:exosome complex component RRP4